MSTCVLRTLLSCVASPTTLVLQRWRRFQHMPARWAEKVSLRIRVQHQNAALEIIRSRWQTFVDPPNLLAATQPKSPSAPGRPSTYNVAIPLRMNLHEIADGVTVLLVKNRAFLFLGDEPGKIVGRMRLAGG